MKLFEYVNLTILNKQDPFYVRYLKGKKVLDVACGKGQFLLRDPKNYIGVDLDQVLVDECKSKGLRAFCMNALNLDFPNESYDAIHAANIIEHFSSADAVLFLTEISRVLKPGGVIYLSTPGVKNVWNTFSHIRPYPPSAFKKLLKTSTENYIKRDPLDLYMVDFFGSRYFFKNRVLNFLFGILDIIFPTSDPIGWIVILKKINS